MKATYKNMNEKNWKKDSIKEAKKQKRQPNVVTSFVAGVWGHQHTKGLLTGNQYLQEYIKE